MSEIVISIIVLVLLGILIGVTYYVTKGTNKWKPVVKAKLKELDARTNNFSDISIAKAGLIDMDKLLDHALKMSGFKGETMGERLKNAKTSYDKKLYNEIWEGHKYRNNLVHEFDFVPIVADIKKHYWNLRRGLISLL